MTAEWLEQARRLAESFGGRTGDPTAGGPARKPTDCRGCPLCQFLAVLRGERPEVTAALADVLTATANALHAFAAVPDEPPAGHRRTPDGESPAGEAGESRAPGGRTAGSEPPLGEPPPIVQRIEIA
jgi:hypothetical protein